MKIEIIELQMTGVLLTKFWNCPLCDRELKVFESYRRDYLPPRSTPLLSAWCSLCCIDIWPDNEEQDEKQFCLNDQDITLEEIERLKKLRSFQ